MADAPDEDDTHKYTVWLTEKSRLTSQLAEWDINIM